MALLNVGSPPSTDQPLPKNTITCFLAFWGVYSTVYTPLLDYVIFSLGFKYIYIHIYVHIICTYMYIIYIYIYIYNVPLHLIYHHKSHDMPHFLMKTVGDRCLIDIVWRPYWIFGVSRDLLICTIYQMRGNLILK